MSNTSPHQTDAEPLLTVPPSPPNPDLDDDDTPPTGASPVQQIHRFVTRLVGRDDLDANLTVRQLAILMCLQLRSCADGVKGLAEYLRVSKPVISRGLDRLAELGLVVRSENPDDRRTIHVNLTEPGRHLVGLIETE